MLAIHHRYTGTPLEQIAKRCQLQPVNTAHVGRWDTECENQALGGATCFNFLQIAHYNTEIQLL